MNSEKKPNCNFSLQKGDAEYLYGFLEKIPDFYRNKARHIRVLQAIESELQRWQLEWIANQEKK